MNRKFSYPNLTHSVTNFFGSEESKTLFAQSIKPELTSLDIRHNKISLNRDSLKMKLAKPAADALETYRNELAEAKEFLSGSLYDELESLLQSSHTQAKVAI